MNAALQQIAKKSKICDVVTLQSDLYEDLGGALYAKIEGWSADNPNAVRIPIEKSIYRLIADKYVSHFGILPVQFKKFYTENIMMMDGIVFGDDKLGHFFQIGYDIYYWVARKKNPTMTDVQGIQEKYGDWRFGVRSLALKSFSEGDDLAIELIRFSEAGQWGMSGSGVKSYGDMAANWEGYHFWGDLVDGPHPYFKCKNGHWATARTFEWRDYITPAWDEANNCNDAIEVIAKSVSQVLAAEKKAECPVDAAACAGLVKRFGAVASKLLNPRCVAAGTSTAK